MHSLRARLVAALLALFALVGVVVGVVTAVELHAFLLHRLDVQLASSRDRFAGALAGPLAGSRPPSNDRRGGFLGTPGQSVDTLGARIVDGRVTQGGVLDRSGAPEQLSSSEAAALVALPVDGRRPQPAGRLRRLSSGCGASGRRRRPRHRPAAGRTR